VKLKLLILILALQSAWILGTALFHEHALSTAPTVLLETERVDPRDLLRGDYLILNYKISGVPTNLFSPPLTGQLAEGETVFVALKQGTNQFHTVSRASTARFPAEAGEIVLRGQSGWTWRTNGIQVHYGLERYYVAEGTGNPQGKLTVQVAVPPSGRALIREVFVDGKPFSTSRF
jgi:uncharacterized membrane-anchored protein